MTVDEIEFDLQAQLRKILDETTIADPGDIASKLLENMTSKQLRAVAFRLLRNWVRVQLHGHRIPPKAPAERPQPSRPATLVDDGQPTTAPAKRRTAHRNSARPRVMLTGEDRLERALSGRFTFNNRDWAMAADLTVEQVRSIAATQFHGAARLTARGTNWDALADAMVEHGVTRVRDLPEPVLFAFFGVKADAA